MFSEADVAGVRHVVQRILVPCVFVIGLLGNSVSIYVLTRKRMRCTTNIYLTALAITDIIYLSMALLLSLKHYDYVQRNCEPYWKYYGIVVWLCDACAYISIYIAVCFTIERFIAIRYPLKRQKFCTESLAKKVITGVSLFCLLSTLSTAFEHQYRTDFKMIDSEGMLCNITLANAPNRIVTMPLEFTDMWQGSGNGPTDTKWTSSSLVTSKAKEAINLPNKHELTLNIPFATSESFIPKSYNFVHESEFLTSEPNLGVPISLVDLTVSANETSENGGTFLFNVTEYCQNVTFYQNSYSSLAQNVLYTRVWYYFTLFVFVLIPLCVLATFNCFLIMLVHRSKNIRGEMTNANSMRKPKSGRKLHKSSVSQENRVTVTLIAVVLLFIVCQLPWAIYLIVSEHAFIEVNLQKIIGNVFNFLAAINAAANFFLYCVLSDKYRKTVRELITGYRYRVQRNNHTNASVYTNTNTTVNGSRRYHRPASSSMVIK